jgi:Amt family ammonium transporter
VIFKFINLIQPIRVSEEEEEMGLDESQHNEKYSQGTLLVEEKVAYIEKNSPLQESLT